MARKFTYRGKTIEELKAMSLDDFVAMLPSKLKRTMKRLGVQTKKFIEKFRKKTASKPFKTHFRQMVILPEMVGRRFQVYNGKEYFDFVVEERMLGLRLGDFSHTIKLVKHSGPGIGATRGSKAVELK